MPNPLLLDDEQAAQLYAGLDTVQGPELESHLNALESWATDKIAKEQDRVDADNERIYSDVNAWWKENGDDAVDEEVKLRTANRRFIASQFGQTPDEQMDLYPSYRDQWTLDNFGKKGLSESETFHLIAKGFQTRKQVGEAIDMISGDVALALFQQQEKAKPGDVASQLAYLPDVPTMVSKWKQENADLVKSLPDNWEPMMLRAAGDYMAETEQLLRNHGPVLQKLYTAIQKETGRHVPDPAQQGAFGDRFVDPRADTGMQESIDQLAQLPKDVRDRGYAALLMAAKRQGIEEKGFLQMAGEAWSRTINTVRTMGNVASEMDAEERLRILQSPGPVYRDEMTGGLLGQSGAALTAASGQVLRTRTEIPAAQRQTMIEGARRDLARLEVLRELRDFADNRFDPVRSNAKGMVGKFFQDIALQGPQSLLYTGMAAVPVAGTVLTGASIFADEYNQLRLDGMSASQAKSLAAVSAPIQAALEVTSAKLLFGRFPWYKNFIAKLVNPRRFARTAQGAASFFGKALGENLTEASQDLTTPLIQDAANALGADIPDVDWNKTLTQWKDTRLEVFAATLMPIIGGHVVETYADDGRFRSAALRDKVVYTPLGLNEQEKRHIEDAATPEEKRARFSQIVEALPPERVKASQEALAKASQEALADQQDASRPTLETAKDEAGRVTYIVRDEAGNEVYRTENQAAAEQAYVLATSKSSAAQFAADRLATKELVDWWVAQDPNNVARTEQSTTPQQELDRLQGLGDAEGIRRLHARISQIPASATGGMYGPGLDYSQLTILGGASVETVAEGVFRGVITLNEKSRPKDALEEINHVFVRRAKAEGRVSDEQLREWITATEAVTGETYAKENFDDLVESLAVIAEAYAAQKIDQNAESHLPSSFVDYLKRLVQVLKEVLARGLALRRGFADGTLGGDYEQFLAESVGLDEQTQVDRARERTEQEVVAAPEVANYSIGALGYDNPFMHPRSADGKYKGAPKWINAPKTRRGKDEAYMRLRERLYQLVQEGAAGRFWYEDSGRAVLRMFNNNVVEAEKFIELLAIYSPQATVEVNTYFALRAYIQRAVNAAKEDFAVKTGAQDDKAKSVLYDNQPWAGRKTDNFYKNIMYVLLKELPASEVAKLKLDAEVYEMLQKPVTVDMWVYRAFGFDSDALTDVAGTGAFGFAERELNLIAEELNASLPEGVPPYLPHQIQAMLCTAIKGRAETKEVKDLTEAQSMKAKDMVKVKNAQGKLVREFKDKEAQKRHMQRWITNAIALPAEKLDVSMAAGAFDRFINSVSMRALWESVPSTNTPEGAAIANLTTAQKAAFTRASREIILDENGNDMLAAMLGVPINVSKLLSGGYGTGSTPNVVTELFPNKPSGTYDDDVVRAYARAIQYIFRQDAVPWMRYIKYGAENEKSYYAESPKGSKRRFSTQAEAEAYAAGKEGYVVKGDAENFAVRLDFGEQLTSESLDNLQQGLVKVHESLGFTQVSPTQVIVTNFRDSQTGLPALTDEEFSKRLGEVYGQQADIAELYTVGEYGPVHDWSADPEGGSILQASSRFGPDLLEWIRGRRQVSDALQKDWSEGRGVVSNYSIGTSAFQAWFADSKVVDDQGNPLVVYHGTRRPDRVGNRFRKARATSGPMAFFTATADIASSYAEGKVDTSLEMPSDYAGWFKYKGKGMRSAVDIDRAWYQLTPEQRETISQRIYTVGYQNWDDASGPIVGDSQSIMGRDSIDWQLREARGNALRALVEIWLNSGSLFNDEQMFMQVLESAGMDMSAVTYDSPHAVKSAVYPAYLSIHNPLNTDNIPADVMSALEQSSKRKRAKRSAGGNADAWDKNTISGKDWMEVLKSDRGTSAWTRIPDWVTETLQALGYDGILDTGGKLGGPKHQVWIPFEETQVKSATGNRGTFDQNDPRIDYSISTQSEIDRVHAAMGALDRDPLERVKIYQKAQDRFLRVMAENLDKLAAMKSGDLSSMRRTQVLQALGELDGIISALPEEVRGKIGGYTQLAKIDPMDVFKGGQKISEVRGMSGAIISAWMREGLNIGEAQKKTELPAGYLAERNLDPARADRAIADVFVKRMARIDEVLERFLRDEYNTAAVELFKRARPQRDAPGQKPKGKLGADVHDLFNTLKEATEWSAEEAQAEADNLWARIEAGELSPAQEAHASLAAQVIPLFADWTHADSTQRAAAVDMGRDILNRAYKAEKARMVAERTKRGYDRMDLSEDAGVASYDDKARQEQTKKENSLPKKWEGWTLNLLNFDQVVSYIFGSDSKVAAEIVNRQRKADNDKSDGIAALSDEWAAFLTKLGGGTMEGQRLLFDLSRMDKEIDKVPYSQNQLVAVTMMWLQPKGKQHMEGYMDSDGQPVGKWHYNQEFVDKAEALLSPEAKAVRSYLLQKYEQEYEAINKVYRKVYGLNLPKNQFYSPLVVESIRAAAPAGIDPVTGGVFAVGANSPGALRSRGGAIAQPVFRDAVQTYFAHMLQMEHWKAYAQFNSEAAAILGHRDTRNVVKGKAGEQAAAVLNNWLTYFAQGGNKDAANHLAINQTINRVTGNFAAMALFGRVSTLALQVTQLGAASAKMPVGAYLSRFGKLMSGRLGWRAAIDSAYIQRRIKDMPPAVALAMQGLRAEKPRAIREAARRMGQLISGFDGLFTAGTYAMVYDYQLAQAKRNGMVGAEAEANAHAATERIVDEIAQPTRAGARSIYELNNTNPVARAVWAFASEARKNLGMTLYSGAADTKRNFGKSVFYVLVLNSFAGAVIRSALRDMRDDDDEEIFDEKNWGWNRMAAILISDPLYGFPVVGEAMESAVFNAFGVYKPGGPVFDLAPAVPAVKRLPQHAMDVLEGEADYRAIVRDVNRILSTAGLVNADIAAAASLSNLAKDIFEVATANLPEQ